MGAVGDSALGNLLIKEAAAVKGRRSFTLIEVILAIVVVGVIASGFAIFSQKVAVDSAQMVSIRGDLNNEARRALTMMSREIRMVKDAYGVENAESQRLEFNDVNSTSIEYSLSGTDLMRNSDVLCSYVVSFQFTYINRQGNTIASPKVFPQKTDIWLVKMNLGLKKGDEQKSVGMVVRPRNFVR